MLDIRVHRIYPTNASGATEFSYGLSGSVTMTVGLTARAFDLIGDVKAIERLVDVGASMGKVKKRMKCRFPNNETRVSLLTLPSTPRLNTYSATTNDDAVDIISCVLVNFACTSCPSRAKALQMT